MLIWPSLPLLEGKLRPNETILCSNCGTFFGPKMGWENLTTGYPLKAGHPLEGSCQEGKHPPYTPFCIFCRGMSHGISLPICRFARTRVFSDCDVTRSMATHQTPIRIKAHDGHLALWPGIRPLAHLVPQKTLGTLPCPSVTSTVHVALPQGSTPKLARGRGVAKTRQVAWRPSVRG